MLVWVIIDVIRGCLFFICFLFVFNYVVIMMNGILIILKKLMISIWDKKKINVNEWLMFDEW